MKKIFISFYYEQDYLLAVAIKNYLSKRGYDVVNLEEKKREGKALIKWIDSQIEQSDMTILIVSELTYTRKYVLYELEKSMAHQKIIVPVKQKGDGKVINPLSLYNKENKYPVYEFGDVCELRLIEHWIKNT